MTDLPSFTADFAGGLKKIVYTLTGGELTKVPLSGVTVRFTSNVPAGEWITFGGETFPATAPPGQPAIDQVVVSVAPDGTLAGAGDPVKLLANNPGLNVTNVQWTAQVEIPGRRMRPITFDAPDDGAVLDLAVVTPVPQAPAVGIPVTMAMVLAAIAAGGGGGGSLTVIDGGDAASSGVDTIDGGSA